ncbi:MAG: hypothetical protein ACLP7P_19120 [Rhodomicrobium sp.]
MERGAKRPRGSTLKLLSLIKSKGLDAVLRVAVTMKPFELKRRTEGAVTLLSRSCL